MKLFIINPDSGMTRAELDARCAILQNYVAPDVELTMECLTQSNIELDSALDATLAAPEIVSMAISAERAGYDAIVLYCFSDPAIDACREACSIPVIGGAQASMLLAPHIARHVGVLITMPKRLAEKECFLRTLGLDASRLAGVRALSEHINIWEAREHALTVLTEAGRKLIEQDHAQAIVLGCLAFLGMAPELSARLGVPVIDAALAAVSVAESVARQRLATSKHAYPAPAQKLRRWEAGELE